MFDFHIEIHEKFSPATAIFYAKNMGLKGIAIVLPIDYLPQLKTTCEFSDYEILEQDLTTLHNAIDKTNPQIAKLLLLQKQIDELAIYENIQCFFGIKLMHIPPSLIEKSVLLYRALGIHLIAVHGESISDMVEQGTNFNACLAHIDILYHAGLIDEKCVELAKENNVFLEICSNPKHAYTNAHIAKIAEKYGAKIIFGSGATKLEELHSPEMQKAIYAGALIYTNNNNELLLKLQTQFFQKGVNYGNLSKM